MADYLVEWLAPASEMPAGSPEEDHYEVKFGARAQQEPKGEVSSKFVGVDEPGEYATSVQLYDVDGMAIGALAVGPVIVIGDRGVTVHIPEGVTAGLSVTILP